MGREHVIPEFCLRMNELTTRHPDGAVPVPIQGSGQETRSFCYVSDCTDQLVMLADNAESGIWNVGTMEEHTIADVAYRIAGMPAGGTSRSANPVRCCRRAASPAEAPRKHRKIMALSDMTAASVRGGTGADSEVSISGHG